MKRERECERGSSALWAAEGFITLNKMSGRGRTEKDNQGTAAKVTFQLSN